MNRVLQRIFGIKPSQPPTEAGLPLALIQQHLREALGGCQGPRPDLLHFKINVAKTPVDLWALRSDMHQCIARMHTESVAAARINDMAIVFEGWVPAAKLKRIQPGFKPSQG